MKLTVTTCAEILIAAVKLQIAGLTQYCIDHLKVNIDCENCVEVFHRGQENGLAAMEETAVQFMTESFGTITQTDGFVKMTCSQLKVSFLKIHESNYWYNLDGSIFQFIFLAAHPYPKRS